MLQASDCRECRKCAHTKPHAKTGTHGHNGTQEKEARCDVVSRERELAAYLPLMLCARRTVDDLPDCPMRRGWSPRPTGRHAKSTCPCCPTSGRLYTPECSDSAKGRARKRQPAPLDARRGRRKAGREESGRAKSASCSQRRSRLRAPRRQGLQFYRTALSLRPYTRRTRRHRKCPPRCGCWQCGTTTRRWSDDRGAVPKQMWCKDRTMEQQLVSKTRVASRSPTRKHVQWQIKQGYNQTIKIDSCTWNPTASICTPRSNADLT